MDKVTALALVNSELDRAQQDFPPFVDYHEGYAKLYEEVDELWEAVRGKSLGDPQERRVAMGLEAIQVAAMALRFLIDLIGDEGTGPNE
jgi:hypothetical protein